VGGDHPPLVAAGGTGRHRKRPPDRSKSTPGAKTSSFVDPIKKKSSSVPNRLQRLLAIDTREMTRTQLRRHQRKIEQVQKDPHARRIGRHVRSGWTPPPEVVRSPVFLTDSMELIHVPYDAPRPANYKQAVREVRHANRFADPRLYVSLPIRRSVVVPDTHFSMTPMIRSFALDAKRRATEERKKRMLYEKSIAAKIEHLAGLTEYIAPFIVSRDVVKIALPISHALVFALVFSRYWYDVFVTVDITLMDQFFGLLESAAYAFPEVFRWEETDVITVPAHDEFDWTANAMSVAGLCTYLFRRATLIQFLPSELCLRLDCVLLHLVESKMWVDETGDFVMNEVVWCRRKDFCRMVVPRPVRGATELDFVVSVKTNECRIFQGITKLRRERHLPVDFTPYTLDEMDYRGHVPCGRNCRLCMVFPTPGWLNFDCFECSTCGYATRPMRVFACNQCGDQYQLDVDGRVPDEHDHTFDDDFLIDVEENPGPTPKNKAKDKVESAQQSELLSAFVPKAEVFSTTPVRCVHCKGNAKHLPANMAMHYKKNHKKLKVRVSEIYRLYENELSELPFEEILPGHVCEPSKDEFLATVPKPDKQATTTTTTTTTAPTIQEKTAPEEVVENFDFVERVVNQVSETYRKFSDLELRNDLTICKLTVEQARDTLEANLKQEFVDRFWNAMWKSGEIICETLGNLNTDFVGEVYDVFADARFEHDDEPRTDIEVMRRDYIPTIMLTDGCNYDQARAKVDDDLLQNCQKYGLTRAAASTAEMVKIRKMLGNDASDEEIGAYYANETHPYETVRLWNASICGIVRRLSEIRLFNGTTRLSKAFTKPLAVVWDFYKPPAMYKRWQQVRGVEEGSLHLRLTGGFWAASDQRPPNLQDSTPIIQSRYYEGEYYFHVLTKRYRLCKPPKYEEHELKYCAPSLDASPAVKYCFAAPHRCKEVCVDDVALQQINTVRFLITRDKYNALHANYKSHLQTARFLDNKIGLMLANGHRPTTDTLELCGMLTEDSVLTTINEDTPLTLN
jgi:hypothetical protein